MTFNSTDPCSHKGKSDVWLTPLWIIESLDDGVFDLDPCGEYFHKTAKEIYTEYGLEKNWFGKIWLNPPYSEHEIWMKKLKNHGFGTALLFNRFDTKSFQKYAIESSSIFFLEGRIKFLKISINNQLIEKNNAGCGSVLISYGYTPDYSKLKGWKAK